MKLNDIKPAEGSHKARKRVGRGAGSGTGKTAGRGMKGQKSRSGGFHKSGFEGGQMPIQRRLPKIGFTSNKERPASLRLDALNKLEGEVTLDSLKAANLIGKTTDRARVYLAGEISKKLNVSGIAVTKGAREAIEKAGGSVA